MINVTKTFLPPQEEYQKVLSRAWDTGWMTNRGLLVQELEAELKNYLGVSNVIAMTNGTLPIQIALKALEVTGDVITTPFSYVATTSSIVWEGCTPVFVDIHPEYLTIDETKIEAVITPNTSAILATHVFGNPCNIGAIESIAKKHNLKVIYDGAHCFGVEYKGQSIFEYGDVSTCSFHATKLFHTGEGGALFCNEEQYNAMFYHHNFGHQGKEAFQGLGINSKMSELQAAMGLAVLPYLQENIRLREKVIKNYKKNIDSLKTMKLREGTDWNSGYFPIVGDDEEQTTRIKANLEAHSIFPRRYFYPSLNTLPYVKRVNCPISETVASRILCLPLYESLSVEKVEHIADVVNSAL